MTNKLIIKADEWFASQIREAADIESLGHELSRGGFVKVNFCSIEKDGIRCAEQIKERFHAEVRGVRIDVKENPRGGAANANSTSGQASHGKCIVCGSNAKHVVYVAKQY